MNQKQLKVVLYLLSFILLLSGSAYATTILGPQNFTINRWHYHCSYQTFTVGIADKGKLTVTKVTFDKKIKGGFILFNRQFIPLRKFLRGDHEEFTRKINFRLKNKLIVLLKGKPGATITIEVKQTGTINPPEARLTAEPTSIVQGNSSTLTWLTSYADLVTIEPEIGEVDPAGSVSVSPVKTTRYTLTAKGAEGTVTAQTEVKVTLPPPTVTITAEPDTIAPGNSTTLSWSSEHAATCSIEPYIGDVTTSGSINMSPGKTTTYTITAIGSGGTAQAQVLVQLYPIKIKKIDKSQAHYTTPENTKAAITSALLQHDLDWYYEAFTKEAAAYHKQLYANAGIDSKLIFNLKDENDEEFILDQKPYKEGLLVILENKLNDINGTVSQYFGVVVLEDGLWKATFKYSNDEELEQYHDVQYTDCIANYNDIPANLIDYCWHDNDLTNYNETIVVVGKRNGEHMRVASLNGINNGFGREVLNDMPREQLSMGGWIKADNIDHNARIIEIGQDRDNSTAIVLDPGNGLRYWIHVDGRRVERTAAMDYDFHDNQWHHVYLTYDGSSIKLYVDAELKDSHPVSGPIDSAATLNIGQHNSAVYGGTSKPFKGRLDDLQLYNKALTADEILIKFEDGSS